MLPLDVKVDCSAWPAARLLKIAGLADVAEASFPFERMMLDLRDVAACGARAGSLLELPWAGFLADDSADLPDNRPGWVLLGDRAIVRPGDVVEAQPWASRIAVRFRRGDGSNVLFATERCNSYCLMCSQPPRAVDDEWRVEQLCDLAALIDKNADSLAISGGEPTLLGAGLLRVVRTCAKELPTTSIHVLSNGRLLADRHYTRSFEGAHPALSWGVPLYGDHYRLHDYVVQSEGAFSETVRGLYALHEAAQSVEIRVVLVRPVVERLMSLLRYLARNFPFVDHVALMGAEPVGFAKAHHSALWCDPADFGEVLADACYYLDARGMPVSLFNLPLCILPRRAWTYARRSISEWKQHYLPDCEGCGVRDRCAGFFAWTTPQWTSRAIHPIEEEEGTCATY